MGSKHVTEGPEDVPEGLGFSLEWAEKSVGGVALATLQGHGSKARAPWQGQSRESCGVSQEESGSEQHAGSGGVRSRQSRGAGRGV